MSAPGIVRGSMEAMVQPGEVRVQRALLSVSDKTGIVEFARGLASMGVELVVLAGYMALLDPRFLARFPGRVINVHPALLPAFPGLRAIEQALAYGVKVFGVTVHFVDEGIDSGPIILQQAIELPEATHPSEVRDALRPIEHELLTGAVRLIASGTVRPDPSHPRRVLVGGTP